MTYETKRLLEAGFVPVDLKAGNVKVGDNISNHGMCFGTLKKITKKGNYKVRFDMDYYGEPLTKFTPEDFERIFLVDKRKKD
jgi:riboflavin synthase alpha subunit